MSSNEQLFPDRFTRRSALPEAKAWVVNNVSYGMQTRVVFQCRSRFWKTEGISINISPGHPALYNVWECATEIAGDRGILLASAAPGTTRAQALEALRAHYPGKALDVEHVFLKDWFREAWAPVCEWLEFPVGQLAKFCPGKVALLREVRAKISENWRVGPVLGRISVSCDPASHISTRLQLGVCDRNTRQPLQRFPALTKPLSAVATS